MKFKRVALVIKGYEANERASILQEMHFDISSFRIFLQSAAGGGWQADEIITMANPSLAELQNYSGTMQSDYAIFYFSGHGMGENSNTYIQLNRECIIDIKNLPTFALKQLNIFDSCRSRPILLNEMFLHYPEMSVLSNVVIREIYDRMVQRANPGTSYMFSCSYGETSISDNFTGSYFTNSLIAEAITWSVTLSDSVKLSITEACQLSLKKIRLCYGDMQKPELLSKSGSETLPFALNIRSLIQQRVNGTVIRF